MNTQRNATLDLLKLFASYMVVFIHISFCGTTGVIIDALARFAVPLFFLISGFYSYKITPEKIKKRIGHIIRILIFATVCYTFFNIGVLILRGDIDGIVPYFSKYFNLTILLKLFIFNIPVSAVHLWYLLAVIYVYILFYIITILHVNEKVIFIVSFFLLFLHLLLGECLSAFGIELAVPLVRNFALMGIPFFALGLLAKKYENKLLIIPNYILIIAAVIGALESIFSRCFWGKNELYIGSLFVLFAVVILTIKYSNVKYSRIFDIFTGCSTYIYVFHIMVSSVIVKIYILFNINYNSSIILKNIHPLLVCIASTILAYFITWINNRFSLKSIK